MKIDLSNIVKTVLSQQQTEEKIGEYKYFYKTHLTTVQNRNEVLNRLNLLCVKFQKTEPRSPFITDPERTALQTDTIETLKKYFSPSVLQLYNKEIPRPTGKREIDRNDKWWEQFIAHMANSFEELNEQYRQEWRYKTNFIIFLRNCLLNYGLHPDILRRDVNTYKRYNFILEHFFKSKNVIKEFKILLTPEILQKEYLSAYERKLPIKLNGKLIPFKDIYSIKITSTLLLDDEIPLFAIKNKFNWTTPPRDELRFTELCQDETDHLHKNPYLLDDKEVLRNQNTYFVNPTRIDELKKIKNKKFDLTKLIRLCEELNNASATKNNFSSSLLVRAIIDHVPPIFNHKTFSEVANNYTGGTRSFKKSMLNLDNSLRNIADNNIHSQVRKKEVLPTPSQTDFTPELDLLLSEVVRILK